MEFYERVSGARMHAAFYRPNEVNTKAISSFLIEDIVEFIRNCSQPSVKSTIALPITNYGNRD